MSSGSGICARCVMDSSMEGIVFDEQGICNYCTEFLERSRRVLFQKLEDSRRDRSVLSPG